MKTAYESPLTSDLSRLGARERKMLMELLEAWDKHGLPDDFEYDEVNFAFNTHSGYVFLTNAEFQVAMMNGDKLESWYNCPYCGHEGFKEDMQHDAQDEECTRYMDELGL